MNLNKIEIAGLLLVALLFFVWPVPHTISLRDILLLFIFILFGWLAYRQASSGWPAALKVPGLIYIALSAWILVGALLLSDQPVSSLDQVRSQWLKGFVALLSGVWAGSAFSRDNRRATAMLTVVVLILAAHVLYIDFIALSSLIEHGNMGYRFGVFGGEGPDKSNYLTNLLLIFLFADILRRITQGQRGLPFGNLWLGILTLGALLSQNVTGMRNGVIEFTLIFIMITVLFVMENRWRGSRVLLISGVALLLLVPATLGYFNYKNDPRWLTFIETIPVAWDTETHKAWLNEQKYGLPQLPDGRLVDVSAYQRIAAIKEGARLVIEHPLGNGYGRNAYGDALQQKYGERSLGHSHSGFVDLAIGTGVPGALLWLGFLTTLVITGWRSFRATKAYAPLLLLLITAGYGARMLVDSVIRDHMLQQFLFLLGLLAVMTVVPAGSRRVNRP